MMASRFVAASLMVGLAAAQGFSPPPVPIQPPPFPISAPSSPRPPHPSICLPDVWKAGYTRASDYAAAEGTVTHDYAKEVFALKETSFGKGDGGKFQFYSTHFYQLVNQSWAGITWADGTTHCYKSSAASEIVLKQCLNHVGTETITLNGWPAKTAYNVFPNKQAPNEPVIDAMFLSTYGTYTYPLQAFSWINRKERHPNFFILQNHTHQFASNIAAIPRECMSGDVEEGPLADQAISVLARRASLASEEGELPLPKRPVTPEAAARLVSDFKQRSQEPNGQTCVPDIYTSGIYYMNNNFTVIGKLTHKFSAGIWAIAQNITGPPLGDKTFRQRFVQNANQAWVITEAMNGTVTKCSMANVQRQFDQPCKPVHTKKVISMNGFLAYHNDMYDPVGTGYGPTYTAFYQSLTTGLPIGLLNFTNADVGAYGHPKSISFFDVSTTLEQDLLKVPSACSKDEKARAEVHTEAQKWANHPLGAI